MNDYAAKARQIKRDRKKLFAGMLEVSPLRAENPTTRSEPSPKLSKRLLEAIAAHAGGDWFDCPSCLQGKGRYKSGTCSVCRNKRMLCACGEFAGTGWDSHKQQPCEACAGGGYLTCESAA